MRFVRHQHMLVFKQHFCFFRESGFMRHVPVIKNKLVRCIRFIQSHCAAVLVQHMALADALGPFVFGNRRKPFAQKSQQRGPVPGRQTHARGTDAVAHGQWFR